jgi:hypothetical protein
MLYAVMDRGRSDFERFGAEVEPRVRRANLATFGACLASADWLAWAKADEATLMERLAETGDAR